MGNRTVEGCSSLIYIHVPSSATNAGGFGEYFPSTIETAGPTGGGYNFEYDWTTIIGGQYCLSSRAFREVTFPSTTTNIPNYCMHNSSVNVNKIYCYAMTAPTTYAYTFGGSGAQAVGYNNKDAGTNELHVPVGATGYDAGQWAVLVNSLGFTIYYDL